MQPIEIAGRRVGPGQPCFVIAEAGVNHDGDLEVARQLVEAAASAGADAVKFQTFTADRLVAVDAPKVAYQRETTPPRESQHAMLQRLELSLEAHRDLRDLCRARDVLFLSTPFDEASGDLLAALDVPAFKVASGELTNLPLLAHLAGKGRPIIISTGMAELDEIAEALAAARAAGARDMALLHCVSQYPAPAAEVNLHAMQTMAATFDVPVGFSDHTLGTAVSLAAVALGASIIEKHLTLDRCRPGPDHRVSLEPGELKALVRDIRTVEAALGDGRKRPAPSEREMRRTVRRSLVAARDLPAGTRLTEDMIAIKRPGTGLPPAMCREVAGRWLKVDVSAGAVLTPDMLA